MRRFVPLMLSGAIALAILSAPIEAVAAPSAWQKMDIALHLEKAGGVMLVSGELPLQATLPTEAELSVPAGSQLQWIGQIMGGDPSADPALTYTKTTVGSSDVYRFTLTESRIAQVEVLKDDALGFDGTDYEPALSWTATQEVPEVRLAVRVPQGAEILRADPEATLQTAGGGYSMYAKTISNVSAGSQLNLSFAYQAPSPAAQGVSAASSGTGTSAQVLVVLVVLAAGGAALIAIRRKSRLLAPSDASQAHPFDPGDMESVNGEPKKGARQAQRSQASPPKSTVVEVEEDGSGRRSSLGRSTRNLVTAGIAIAVVGAVIVLVGETTKPQMVGDSITQTFSQGQPCSSATIALNLPAGSAPTDVATTLFEALQPLDGMNTATLNAATSVLEVGFCESKANEAVVRQALEPTGLVAPATATPPNATAGGATGEARAGAQSLLVDSSAGTFSPATLSATAGTPIDITFGQGVGCVAEVVFPSLDVRENLEGGPVTINLNALEPGTYPFECGMDMQHGTLVVK